MGRWIMTMHAGCRLRRLYVKGMSITTAAGGALSESRARRLAKAATSAAGRWLSRREEGGDYTNMIRMFLWVADKLREGKL